MDALDVFGPKMTAILLAIAAVYILLAFAPVLWPGYLAYRKRSWLPRPVLYVLTVAALVYGAFSFIAFAIILPAEAYAIYVAPSLAEANVPYGASILSVTRFLANYWWLMVPPLQLALTWVLANHVGRRWQHICAAPPNNSFKPTPLRGAA